MQKFGLGTTVATRAALGVIEAAGQEPSFFIDKHVSGDWGSVDPDDARANDAAVRSGERILSIFQTLLGVEVWVMTDGADDAGNRAATTIFLPSEY